MPTFDTPDPIFAVVELGYGFVRINASDRADTVVDVIPSDESDSADEKTAEQTRVEYSNGRLLVKAPKHKYRWWSFGTGPSVMVTIDLPTGSRIAVDGAAADVRCEGHFGEAKIDSSYGEIWLDRADRVRLHSGYGGITVARSAGHSDIATSGGEVRIDEINGSGVVKNAHGGITVGQVTGDLRLSTASGDITIDRTLATVAAKTAYGGVRIGEVVRGTVVAETSYGRLEIGVAPGTAAWLDVSTQYGRVDSSLEASAGPAESDETAEVRARTSYGDIVIRRA
jgi:DUF4097 and DUF4098 domain-containing protein YvlB